MTKAETEGQKWRQRHVRDNQGQEDSVGESSQDTKAKEGKETETQ